MDITPYVEALRDDLVAAAAAGSPETQQSAEKLLIALEPATRLAMMEAVSQAAAEITSELPMGSVDVRLHGRELDFVVHVEPGQDTVQSDPEPSDADDEGGLARVSLRLPEAVKTKAEDRANQAGQSLNTWLVQAIRNATRDAAFNVNVDLSSLPLGALDPFGRARAKRRMSGWV